MKKITIRNIPDNIYNKLKKRAELSHRSLNSEIIVCLEELIFSNKSEVNKILEESEQIRKRLNFNISLDEIDSAKQSGRL